MKRVLVNDRETPVDAVEAGAVREVGPGVYSVLWNGRSFEVWVVAERGGYTLDLSGWRIQTDSGDPRDRPHHAKPVAGGGRKSVRAAMPGKVVRVLVTAGQEVKSGEGLIVVEAMKMQNEMKVDKPGRVVQVHASDGATVAAGDVLITIE